MQNTGGPTRLTTLIAIAALAASALLSPSAGAATDAPLADERVAQRAWLDTQDRQAVIDSFNAEFGRTEPDIGWTGNHDTCDVGTTSPAYRSSIFQRINWYRSMAGLPPVTENADYSTIAQRAVLTTSLAPEGGLTHDPLPHYRCFTQAALTASQESNLRKGSTGVGAIDEYVLDPGASNVSVGHRNWLLSPTAQQFGTGDAARVDENPASNVLYVVEPHVVAGVPTPTPTIRQPAGYVAWPAEGHTPAGVVYRRWSFSLPDADYAAATVTTSRIVDGKAVAVSSPIVHREASDGAPYDTLVWEPALDYPDNPREPLNQPAVDETYRVTVSNVVLGGQVRSFVYDVVVIGDKAVPRVPTPNENFVNAAYNDFLRRDATAAEKQLWVGRLVSGLSRREFISDLTNSEQWVGAVVDQMYHDTLDRNGDQNGRAFWVEQVQNGTTVADMAASFYGSDEYLANEGNSLSAWIDDLYVELLLRRPDQGGHSYWMQRANEIAYVRVAQQIYQSSESRTTRVRALYQELLGRSSDAVGEAFWVERLLDGDDLALAAELAASDEYYLKAQR